MVSKSQIKLITSLARKKYRNQHQLFLVEGIKGINEFLESPYQLHSLFTTEDVFETDRNRIQHVDFSDLKKLSQLTTPQTAVAVFYMNQPEKPVYKGITLALDGIRDPGNLGTIIRLCDWFGVNQLVCSPDTVDAYNPKVVQATMGSLPRINIIFSDLKKYISEAPANFPIIGTFMEGKNVYSQTLPSNCLLIMGNEANGISFEIEKAVTEKLAIPQFGNKETESLNVATATAILLSEFRRGNLIER